VSRPGAIDGGVFIGRDETTGIGADAPPILATLDSLGVDRALALAPRAIWFDDEEGNRDLLAACRAAGGRLLPAAVVNLTGYDAYAERLHRLKSEGFRIVALVSGVFGWTLEEYAFQALVREAAAAGMPLQVCVKDRRDLRSLADATTDTTLPVMVRWMRGGGYYNLADILALAQDRPGLVFDVSQATQIGGIEHLVARAGAARFFLASNHPQSHAGAHWFTLHAARLAPEDLRAIAGGTLAHLLGIEPPATVLRPPALDELRAQPKIDTHWHTSGWNAFQPRSSIESVAEDARDAGIEIYLSSSLRALSDDLVAGNDETARLLDHDPRARGMVVVNPLQTARSIAELERFAHDPRFVGVKTIQDFYGLRLDDARYAPILEALAGRSDWPLMAHLPGMKEAAQSHPEVWFVAAHSTWRHRELATLPNVWFDIATSTSSVRDSDIADLVTAVGASRVVFSSDAPLITPAFTLGKLAGLGLDKASLEAILRTNALRAFPRLARATTTHAEDRR
jgi:predicted TIM-barrel fold metal-dependent hydrolase